MAGSGQGNRIFFATIVTGSSSISMFTKGADPKNKAQVHLITLNGSGIRDIHRVTKLSLVCILSLMRRWFKQNKEPCFKGSYGQVQLDELWTFVKHRKGKRRVWYSYDKESGKILAFQIGKRGDKSCKVSLDWEVLYG